MAFTLDLYSRRVVGWSMATHLRTEFVVDTLEMALWRRKPDAGLIHRTDRGVQYTALSFGKMLEGAGIVPSIGRTGSALDNAISESFVASLKTEFLHRHAFSVVRLPGRLSSTILRDSTTGFDVTRR